MKVSKMTRILSIVFLLFAFFVFYPGVTKGEHPWEENNVNSGDPIVEPPVVEEPTFTPDPTEDPDPDEPPIEPEGTSTDSSWWNSLWDWMNGSTTDTGPSAG